MARTHQQPPPSKNVVSEDLRNPHIDWSGLPTDALEQISNHLTFDPDYFRFRSVCRSWRSAAPKRPQPPWLIGHRKDEDGNRTIFSFHKLSSDGQISQFLDLPESPLLGGMPCQGSSHGWMALLDFARLSVLLWNPLTRSQIQLPSLQDGGQYHYESMEEERRPGPLPFQEREDFLVCRLILSADPGLTSDYAALAACVGDCTALYRARDSAWTILPVGGFTGAAFYGGHIYVSVYEDVYVCKFGQGRNGSVKKILSASWDWDVNESHLVASGGDLLLVLVYWYGFGSKDNKYLFSVRKVDLARMKLVTLQSLGDRALFVERNHSFSVIASRVPGCKRNAIYFTVSRYDLFIDIPNKIMVYDMKDESSVFVPSDADETHPDWKPYAWFAPSLLS